MLPTLLSIGKLIPMKTLQSLQWTPPSASQKRRLADWLGAWNLDRRLSGVHFGFEAKRPTTPGPVAEIASRIAPFDNVTLNVGEIRLISSLLLPECPRPLYAAVLAEWEQGLWLISPYGRFSAPATPGELLTGRAAAALRVLCLWNAHPVPVEVLQRSWLVEHMSREEMDDSWSVFHHALAGKVLPSSLHERVGPPIFRNEDPRVEYQQQEAGFLEPLKTRAIEWVARLQTTETSEATGIIVLPGLDRKPEEEQLALAAAGKRPARKLSLIQIVSPPVQLRFTIEGDDKTISIWVLDKKGEPASQLNGARFLSKEGAQLGVILDAQCLLYSGQIAGGFRLVTKEGKLLKVKTKARR